MRRLKKEKAVLAGLILLFILVFFLSACLGRYFISPGMIAKILASRVLPLNNAWPPEAETVLFNVRLPRVILGAFVGAGLACAGSAYQSVFHNPMASPDILGASHGAGFGAALAISMGFGHASVIGLAFAFGLGSIGIVFIVCRHLQSDAALSLVLTGIMVSSLFGAATSFLKLTADPNDTLPTITYWLMGSLVSANSHSLPFVLPVIFIGAMPILLLRWRLNLLTVGDDEARAMGVNTGALRGIIIFCATLITAACVSVSGMIGWVGLVIPHFSRMLAGSDCRYSMPASLLLGGGFMLAVDILARTLATGEIPIGILSAFAGAPFFIYLIIREGKKDASFGKQTEF